MFKDCHHSIELVYFKNKRYFKKGFCRKSHCLYLLKKEYEIENVLSKKSITPNVLGFYRSFFYEEFIITKGIVLDRDFLFKTANIFKRIHELNVNKIAKLIKNDFIKNKKYCLYLLYKKIINNLPAEFLNKSFRVSLDRLIKFYEVYVNNKKLFFCLVHGDLGPKNILVNNKEEIKIIDWSDARIDLPSHDIVQFFYLFKLNKKQQRIFLKFYGDLIYDEIVFDMHLTMLLLYDVVNRWLRYNEIDKIKFNQIVAKIKKYEKHIMFCASSRR